MIEPVTGLRRLRQEAGLGPREPLELAVSGGDDGDALRAQADLLRGPRPRELDGSDVAGGRAGRAPATRGAGARRRARRRLRGGSQAPRPTPRRSCAKAQEKLANARFVRARPAAVVQEERERASALRTRGGSSCASS